MKFDVLDMIREPDNYTSAERAQAAEAIAELLAADAEFDRERDGYNPLFAKRDRLDRYAAAETRRAAALASFGGAA